MPEQYFVKPGQRVSVYQKPYSMEDKEGHGIVKSVLHGDTESVYAEIEFDSEKGSTYGRWLLPQHCH